MEQSSSIFNFKTLRSPILIIGLYLIIEIGFRISFFGFHTVLNWGKYNPQGILFSDIVTAVDNVDVGWKLKPNLDTIFKVRSFTTNSLGLRNLEIPIEKPPGKKRMLVLGRSITMGAGVLDEEVYPRQLQALLDEWKPDSYEIVNCAVGAHSLAQMLHYYDEYLAQLDPDMLLIPLSKDDLLEYSTAPIPLSAIQPEITNLRYYLGFTFVYEASKSVVKKLTNKHIAKDWNARALEITNPQPPQVSNMSLLSDFINARSAENIACYLFSPDRKSNVDANKDEVLKNWCEGQEGATYLGINEYMQDKMPQKTYIYFGDNHPSPAVHALFGEALFNQFVMGVVRD